MSRPVGVGRQRFAAELAQAFARDPAWRPVLAGGLGPQLAGAVAGYVSRHAWRTFSYRRRGGCDDIAGLAGAVAGGRERHDLRQALRASVVEQGGPPALTTLLAEMSAELLHAVPQVTTPDACVALARGLRLVGVAWCAALGRDPERCTCLVALSSDGGGGAALAEGTGGIAGLVGLPDIPGVPDGAELAGEVTRVVADLRLRGVPSAAPDRPRG